MRDLSSIISELKQYGWRVDGTASCSEELINSYKGGVLLQDKTFVQFLNEFGLLYWDENVSGNTLSLLPSDPYGKDSIIEAVISFISDFLPWPTGYIPFYVDASGNYFGFYEDDSVSWRIATFSHDSGDFIFRDDMANFGEFLEYATEYIPDANNYLEYEDEK